MKILGNDEQFIIVDSFSNAKHVKIRITRYSNPCKEVLKMGFKEVMSKYFNNHSETSDEHWAPELRTHYFKVNKEKGMQAVEGYFNRSDSFTVDSVSQEHGEISVNYKSGRKAFIVATVIMVRPFRTAVDFSVTTESAIPMDFGFSHNLIPKLYDELKKELPYIETSKGNKTSN